MEATTLTGSALLCLLVIREVFGFLKAKKTDENKPTTGLSDEQCDRLSQIEAQVADLHRWHNKMDEDGVPVWYVRKSLEKVLETMANNLTVQTEILRKMEIKLDNVHN